MTKDKTVTISRELLDEVVVQLDDFITGDVLERLKSALAAPVVERQPVAILQASYHWQDIWVDVDQDEYVKRAADSHAYKVRMVYTAPPELAELQATIARLTELCVEKDERMSEMNKGWADAIDQRDHAKAEIERLKGGQGEPVAYADPKSFENFKNLAHLGGLYAHEWMWANPAPGLKPLYTSQPAPVAVVLPERKQITGNSIADVEARAHNACIDKVKELNQ